MVITEGIDGQFTEAKNGEYTQLMLSGPRITFFSPTNYPAGKEGGREAGSEILYTKIKIL